LNQCTVQRPQGGHRTSSHGKSEQEDCFVFRKELQVVFKHKEIILFYLRIGRISVFYSDRSIANCTVPERVIDPDDVLLWQIVALAQRIPAVLPFEKFVGEPKFKLGMHSQITDA